MLQALDRQRLDVRGAGATGGTPWAAAAARLAPRQAPVRALLGRGVHARIGNLGQPATDLGVGGGGIELQPRLFSVAASGTRKLPFR